MRRKHSKIGKSRTNFRDAANCAFEGREKMENEGDKGSAPFSAAVKDKVSITLKLAVNIYSVCNSNGPGNH
jgi:hypothetical protein